MSKLRLDNSEGSSRLKVNLDKLFQELRSITNKIFTSLLKRRRGLKNTKMQYKLVLSFVGFSIIPLIILGIFSVSSSSKAIKDKISTYSVQLMNQVNQNINASLFKLRNYSDDIIISPGWNNQFIGYRISKDSEKAAMRLNFSRVMQLKFLNVDNVDDVLMVFMNNENQQQYDISHVGMQFSWEKEDILRIIKLNNQEKNTKNLSISLANIGDSNGYDIIIGRKIQNSLSSEVLGHFLIAVNQDYFRNIYKNIDMGKGSDIFIMNTEGIVISSYNPKIKIGEPFQEGKLTEQIQKNSKLKENTFFTKIDNGNKLIAYSKIEDADWYIVSTIPNSYLNSEASKFNYKIAGLMILILIFAMIFAIIISKNISAPLKKLEKNMSEFGEGKLNKRTVVDRADEIGHLQKSFNSMANHINGLLEKNEEENKLRRITELKVLEYQINPHFLYNTLDSINWMAQKNGQSDISTLTAALARFFRLGLSKGKEIYTLKDEMEHVQNYMIISKIRYKDSFEFVLDMDPSILEYKTVKIILQPLVENALKHGINKNDTKGIISLIGRKIEEDIVLKVVDNGKGMEQEQVEYLNESITEMKDVSAESSGFGLLNVCQRIKLNFGSNYGISIVSRLGEGTIVTIILPVKR